MVGSDIEDRAVNGSEDAPLIVAWLQRWCPGQAREFAVAMHELAAWHYDDSRTARWRSVLQLLPRN